MIERLRKLRIRLTDRIASARKLAADLVSQAATDTLLELDRVIGILETPDAQMNRHTVGHVGAEAEMAIAEVAAMERKFLVAESTRYDVYGRIMRLEVRSEEANAVFQRWKATSLTPGVTTLEIREIYDALIGIIAGAEGQMVADRVRTTIVPPPAPRLAPRKKGKGGTTKGIKGQEPPKHGGFGTSRDAKRRQRRRARATT